MGLRFFLLVNKQGQTRVAQYYQYRDVETRVTNEAEIIRKCLARTEKQCSFMEYRGFKLIFRRYASLYFIVGADNDENELAILEFIHMVVETMDQYFEGVCELDIMFNIDKAHFILDEMIANGEIVETNKTRIIAPIRVIDKVDKLSS
ncbi:clathrin adaptor complex small chain family protein [Salpingoeca rosetta]|uniref:AP complex subunit sigma n=1 Tax=Salpingoeca rosetta (strain ATCC 50818 / BSB-021) TaxID=946362 RepID=F2UG08_SALR5|nr:clathrin adaptor complex small chain family protein [Salpingoeca rosetta]EGD75436.1 clathrin adaptor complex small chain family protein [Salpingoeca rosetta]|eukprot:XP_004991893.1 clathrin adaptor complex small chain family protein [Salpingoeca rosetta]